MGGSENLDVPRTVFRDKQNLWHKNADYFFSLLLMTWGHSQEDLQRNFLKVLISSLKLKREVKGNVIGEGELNNLLA